MTKSNETLSVLSQHRHWVIYVRYVLYVKVYQAIIRTEMFKWIESP